MKTTLKFVRKHRRLYWIKYRERIIVYGSIIITLLGFILALALIENCLNGIFDFTNSYGK